MSEPDSAFLKLQIDRPELLRWLDAAPPKASRWSDWRAIGGRYYFDDGVQDIAEISAAEMAGKVAVVDGWLAGFPTNRALLESFLGYAEEPALAIAGYDRAGATFVCGTLTFAENLNEYIFFLAFARGAADVLAPDRHGLAIIHNYIWGTERATVAALRLSPGASAFLTPEERVSASAAFVDVVEAMVGDEPDPEVSPRVQLDRLR